MDIIYLKKKALNEVIKIVTNAPLTLKTPILALVTKNVFTIQNLLMLGYM